jgi:DNA-binding CsgD family transcriptional regulator
MWSEQTRAREIAALAEIAVAARDRTAFRVAALERLQRVLGFDSAVLAPRPDMALVTLNKTRAMRGTYLASRDRYASELAGLTRAAARLGGVATDDQILPGPRRARSRFYDEIVRPQGIGSLVLGVLAVRRSWIGRVFLARHGRAATPFRANDRERLAALLPVLSLGEGLDRGRAAVRPERATARPESSDGVDWSALTARELELVELVALGWRNPEIALALGVSRFTVRNQLVGVFRKCGATTRAELTRLAVDGGVLPVG